MGIGVNFSYRRVGILNKSVTMETGRLLGNESNCHFGKINKLSEKYLIHTVFFFFFFSNSTDKNFKQNINKINANRMSTREYSLRVNGKNYGNIFPAYGGL